MLFQIRLGPSGRGIHDVPTLAITQRVRQRLHCIADYAIGLAPVHLIGTDLVHQFVDDVAEVQRIEHAHSEIDRELQPRLATCRLDPVRLLEEENAEPVEARILQGEAIFSLIHAEPAGAAGARSEEYIVVDDLLARQPLLFEALQIAH